MEGSIVLIIGSEMSVFINIDMTSSFSVHVEGDSLYVILSDVQVAKQCLHKANSKELAYRLHEDLIQGISYGIQKDSFISIDLRRMSRNYK